MSGKVQGVGYRYFAKRMADTFGLSGHVKNCPDGTVAGEVEGAVASVEAFLEALRKGPLAARVAAVQAHERILSNDRDFEIV